MFGLEMINMDIALFILRVVIGLLFLGHGAQKLFGWFGGRGLEATADFFDDLGLMPAMFWALIAGLAEFLGGLGLAVGLFTPVAAAAIIGVMLMAIIKVHWANGLWNMQGGFEFPLVNLLLAAFLGLFGPGLYALDAFFNIVYPMPITFIIAVIVAVLGVLVGLISSGLSTQPEARGAS